MSGTPAGLGITHLLFIITNSTLGTSAAQKKMLYYGSNAL